MHRIMDCVAVVR